MTPRAKDMHEAWIVLTQQAGATAMRTYDSGIGVDERPILLGIDRKGSRHLLVPLDAEQVETDTSSGVHLIETWLEDRGTTRRFADLWCLVPHLDAVFERFCLDVLEGIESAPTLPAAKCLETLNRWREFLLPERGTLLGRDAIIGLFGELLVLRDLVQVDATRALAGWVGPLGSRHDFRLAGASIEVKSTTARSGYAARINGHDQLEPDLPLPLLLIWHRIEVGGASGETLPELIDQISAVVTERLRFFALLDRVGYRPDDAYAYPERIAILERLAYRVDGGFPRLVSSSFVGASPPAGVSHISYVIQLPADSATALDFDATRAALVSAVFAAD